MSGQRILQAVRRVGVAAFFTGALVATAFPAAALPPGGASPDTPGTSTSVSPRTVEQCGTINWTVSGFPAGETVHLKIDDGDGTDQATHGAGVVQTQRIGSGGSASGSLQLPCDIAPGGHWVRYLATGGENNLGYTARGGSDFTVVARSGGNTGGAGGAAAGQRPNNQAGAARPNQGGGNQANRNQPARGQGQAQAPARNQGQAPGRNQAQGQGQAPARNQAPAQGAQAPARAQGQAPARTGANGGTAAASSGNTGGSAGAPSGAGGAQNQSGTSGGGSGAPGGAIGIDGSFLAEGANTGAGSAGIFDKNADDPSQPSGISQAAAQQSSGARAPVIGMFVGGAILLVGFTAINVWVLLQMRRDRREERNNREQYLRPTQYFQG